MLAWGGTASAQTPDPIARVPPPTGQVAALHAALSEAGRDALTRVAYAEAGGQGDSGLAAVVYAILNRLASGRWGSSIEAVVNARGQFEPVLRAGGDWRALPPPSLAQRARIDTIVNLALDGRLPDLTGGALFFQNPRIVAARAAAGTVSPRLVDFGGSRPSAVIGDHAFYVDVAGRLDGQASAALHARSAADIIVPAVSAATGDPPPARAAPPLGERGLFVRADGAIAEDGP
ncbi:cell wall hydrolase [Caulobacter hibisci]|uniref:Cell wall hydrolase n=1 Tax=Caulobacter hibisci TaxID=2035993 RepID=A0ABS0SXY1_9CAUL|nr:cell wall hydrolase [Caulobacter hibisci]MBI1684276.1 cell wall hydrolase [Caulobacter hibisci]